MRRPVCVFTVLFVLMLTVIAFLFEDSGGGGHDTHADSELTVEGTVKRIESKNGRSVIHLKVSSPADKEISDRILIYLSEDEIKRAQLHIGQRVGIRGHLSLFKHAFNRGQFDTLKYYMNRRYGYVCYDGHVEYKQKAYDPVSDTLYRIGLRTAAVYEEYYDQRYSGIVKALVLAQRSDIDEDVKAQYTNAGISHILALSGLHIVTMGFILFGLLKKMGIMQPFAAVISVVLIVMYCILTGMPTSAVRALIMFLISMGAVLAGRTNDLGTAAALAALIMLIVNPSYLCESGFQLSFAAVTGIGFICPSVRVIVQYLFDREKIRRLHRSDKRRVRAVMALLRTLLFSLSLQMTIVPLTMWYYYQLPTYGIIVNLIVIPLAGILLVGCLVTGIAGNIVLCTAQAAVEKGGSCHVLNAAADGICRMASEFSSWILKLYDLVTEGVNRIPGGLIVTGRPKLWQMTVYYIILVTVAALGYRLMGRERRMKRAALKQRDTGHHDRIEGIGAVRDRIAGYLRMRSVLLLIVMFAGTLVLFIRIQPGCEISALYVGQGQCFVIHGSDVPTVMYDCGSSDVKELGKYTVIPFLKYCGISSIDTVFVSHLDTDHVSGLIELLGSEQSGIKVGRIIIPGSVSQKKSDNYPLLLDAANRSGVHIYSMNAGDMIIWKRLGAKCLSPVSGWETKQGTIQDAYLPGDDINDDSLVLKVIYSAAGSYTEDLSAASAEEGGGTLTALFTGDISTKVEDLLPESDILCCDWLQVAHHGSRTGADEHFVETVSPRVAVISAGINNQYGHPHEETVKMLGERSDTVTFVTAKDGETDLASDGRRSVIRRFIQPEK